MNNKALYVFLLILLSRISNSIAQTDLYPGGVGKGDQMTQSAIIYLSGITYFFPCFGGSGGGHSMAKSNAAFLNGSSYSFTFSGGQGKGDFSIGSSLSTLNGGSMETIFHGGSGRGDILAISRGAIFLNGASFEPTFSGGKGNGSNFAISPLRMLDGSTIPLFYYGGSGNGSASAALTGGVFLNGTSYVFNYPGGIGNGSSLVKTTAIGLSGTPYLYPYFGGSGRGDNGKKSNLVLLNGAVFGVLARAAYNLDFELIEESGINYLKWTNDPLSQAEEYIVEISFDSINFNKVKSEVINGQIETSFRVQVQPINTGKTYYRLGLLDFNKTNFASRTKSFQKFTEENGLRLFPNPAATAINIDRGNLSESVTILVVDITGQKISNYEFEPFAKINFDLSGLPPGLYWVTFISKSLNTRLKFVRI